LEDKGKDCEPAGDFWQIRLHLNEEGSSENVIEAANDKQGHKYPVVAFANAVVEP